MGKSFYRHFKRVIDAGDIAELNVFGRFLTLLDNTSSTDIKVSIGGQSEEDLPSGISVELPDEENSFTLLRFRNTTGASITIKFAVSVGRIFDSRLQLSGSVFDDILNQLQGDSTPDGWGDVAAGLAQVQVVAANANRKSILIQADPTNTGVIYVGYDNTVASNKKAATLPAGQIFSADDCQSAVHVIASAADQSVSYSEL